MKSQKNTGLIQCGELAGITPPPYSALPQGYQLKKIFVAEGATGSPVLNRYPEVEVVQSARAILDDNTIEHILVSGSASHHKHLIGEALRAGKHVRII